MALLNQTGLNPVFTQYSSQRGGVARLLIPYAPNSPTEEQLQGETRVDDEASAIFNEPHSITQIKRGEIF